MSQTSSAIPPLDPGHKQAQENKMIEIKKIGAESATSLAQLAKAIYREHYLHLWHPGGAEWYMNNHAYVEEVLKEELNDHANLHYIVILNAEPAGYLKLRLDYPGVPDAAELERIYLRKATTGKGIGRQLMQLSEQLATSHGKKSIYLKAMDSSTDAIRFYHNLGYTQCGTYTLSFDQMIETYRGMVVLRKQIQ